MSSPIPTHRRTIIIESFDTEDSFLINATLTDERPWADGEELVRDVHGMTLDVEVDRRSFVVTNANATMHRTPHMECVAIEPAFRNLIGLSVTRGFNKSVQERLGRQRGCTHLEFLARAIGPVVIQAMASSSSRQGGAAGISRTVKEDSDSWLTNTCHLWATDSIGATKIREGWRPGLDGYPARTLVEMRSTRS
ncbi:MAG: DUF2889 domain-containing protein [Actinomycetes bacterium]